MRSLQWEGTMIILITLPLRIFRLPVCDAAALLGNCHAIQRLGGGTLDTVHETAGRSFRLRLRWALTVRTAYLRSGQLKEIKLGTGRSAEWRIDPRDLQALSMLGDSSQCDEHRVRVATRSRDGRRGRAGRRSSPTQACPRLSLRRAVHRWGHAPSTI
jgi:hypothetical protein